MPLGFVIGSRLSYVGDSWVGDSDNIYAAETVGLTESLTKTAVLTRGEALAPTETFVKEIKKPILETLGLSEIFSAVKVAFTSVGDAVALTETFTKQVNKAVGETVVLTETFVKTANKALADTVVLTETFTKTANKAVAETVALAESIAFSYFKTLPETVGLTEQLDTQVISGGGGAVPALQMSIAIALRLG